jgi:hypothetical protein
VVGERYRIRARQLSMRMCPIGLSPLTHVSPMGQLPRDPTDRQVDDLIESMEPHLLRAGYIRGALWSGELDFATFVCDVLIENGLVPGPPPRDIFHEHGEMCAGDPLAPAPAPPAEAPALTAATTTEAAVGAASAAAAGASAPAATNGTEPHPPNADLAGNADLRRAADGPDSETAPPAPPAAPVAPSPTVFSRGTLSSATELTMSEGWVPPPARERATADPAVASTSTAVAPDRDIAQN